MIDFRMKISNKRDIVNECSLIVTLTQCMKDRKSAEYIGFRIYKETKTDKKKPNEPSFIYISQSIVGETQAWRNTREVESKLKLDS